MALATTLLDLAIGRRCLACGEPGPPWCDPCLRMAHDPHLVRTPRGLHVHAASDYSGAVRSAILAYKEQGHLSLARPLGRLLASGIRALLPDGSEWRPEQTPLLLVAAPSRRSAVRSRGHDHARRLARSAARWSPGLVGDATPWRGPPALHWQRGVADQGALGAERRAVNVDGAMRMRRARRPGTPVVVVDDIVTTGATMDEAHRALAVAGYRVLGAAVVASVSSRGGVARTVRLG